MSFTLIQFTYIYWVLHRRQPLIEKRESKDTYHSSFCFQGARTLWENKVMACVIILKRVTRWCPREIQGAIPKLKRSYLVEKLENVKGTGFSLLLKTNKIAKQNIWNKSCQDPIRQQRTVIWERLEIIEGSQQMSCLVESFPAPMQAEGTQTEPSAPLN